MTRKNTHDRPFSRDLLHNQRGATAIEYGLIVSLIVIICMVGIRSLGGSNGGKWGNLAERVAAVSPNP